VSLCKGANCTLLHAESSSVLPLPLGSFLRALGGVAPSHDDPLLPGNENKNQSKSAWGTRSRWKTKKENESKSGPYREQATSDKEKSFVKKRRKLDFPILTPSKQAKSRLQGPRRSTLVIAKCTSKRTPGELHFFLPVMMLHQIGLSWFDQRKKNTASSNLNGKNFSPSAGIRLPKVWAKHPGEREEGGSLVRRMYW